MKTYTIIIDQKRKGIRTSSVKISKEGAEIIWKAFSDQFGNAQSMDRREERGGICWLSELNFWIQQGYIDRDFDYRKYEVKI